VRLVELVIKKWLLH